MFVILLSKFDPSKAAVTTLKILRVQRILAVHGMTQCDVGIPVFDTIPTIVRAGTSNIKIDGWD